MTTAVVARCRRVGRRSARQFARCSPDPARGSGARDVPVGGRRPRDGHRRVHLDVTSGTVPVQTASLRCRPMNEIGRIDRRHDRQEHTNDSLTRVRWASRSSSSSASWPRRAARTSTTKSASGRWHVVDDEAGDSSSRRRRSRLRLDVPAGLQRDGDRRSSRRVQPAVTVTYAGGGSGKGQTDLQAGLVQWAGLGQHRSRPRTCPSTRARSSTSRRWRRRSRCRTTSRASTKLQLSPDTLAEDLPGPDQEVERRGDQGRQPGRDAAVAPRSRWRTAPTARAPRRTSPST